MKPLLIERDGNKTNTFARPAPDYIDARVLAANTNEDHTVPATAKYVIFSADGDFYAKPGGTAAVPAADVTNGTGSELNPVIWDLTGVSTIGLIAEATRKVTLTFYKASN